MDIPLFRKRFPFFESEIMWPDEAIMTQYEQVGCYLNPWCQDCSELMEQLMTAHLLVINGSGVVPGVTHTGTVTSASVGGVSVGLSAPTDSSSFKAWLGKTPFGEQLLAIMRKQVAGGLYVGGLPERRAFRKFGGRF